MVNGNRIERLVTQSTIDAALASRARGDVLKLCPMRHYGGVCMQVACANQDCLCVLSKTPWAGLCAVPADHPVAIITRRVLEAQGRTPTPFQMGG
jgi:hypothetical protein